jgi:hypothetical protein
MTNDAPSVAGLGPRAIWPARSLLVRAIYDPSYSFEETWGAAQTAFHCVMTLSF